MGLHVRVKFVSNGNKIDLSQGYYVYFTKCKNSRKYENGFIRQRAKDG